MTMRNMSEPKIRPALSEEEWGRQRGSGRADRASFSAWGTDVDGLGGILFTRLDENLEVEVPEEARHAVAALCLVGQPFGFTHADLEIIDLAHDFVDLEAFFPERIARLRALRGRIAALLSPDSPSSEPARLHTEPRE